MNKEEQFEIPTEFLLNPESIEKFLDMFESRISHLEKQKEEVETARKQIESDLNQLKEKKEILSRYSQFVSAKGFGYTKQKSDEFFEEMRKSSTSRITEEEENQNLNFDMPNCGKSYNNFGMDYTCEKSIFHTGECGIAN